MIDEIDSLDDPRIALYRDLTDRDLTERGEWFIAEGELVVERLLRSDFEVHSVLAIPAKAAPMRELADPATPVYVAQRALLQEIVGFKFHRGVMAIARQRLYTNVDGVMARVFGDEPDHDQARPAVVVVLPHLHNAQNLGAIVRCAAAFGAAAVILGPGGANPFWRYAVRVSMGSMFALPLIRSLDLARDMDLLNSRWGFERVAAVLDDDAVALNQLNHHARCEPTSRIAIVLGSEDQGIEQQWLDQCDRKVTIPMASGVDSLNVAMSAAVMLYHFTQLALAAPQSQ